MNIILLISDTFRWDNLFDRATMPVRTPCLDAFARERAVSCNNMVVSSFPTIPHRTDLTTGRFGFPWYGWQDRLKSSPNHLPEMLRPAGYVSQLICDCPHLFKTGFPVGFDAAMALRGQEGDLYFTRMNHPIDNVMPPDKTRTGKHFQDRNLPDLARWQNRDGQVEEDRFPPRTAAAAVRWLEENYRFDPLFLWVDFFDPHEPWDPPEYMVRRYDPDYTGRPMIHPNYGSTDDLTEPELNNLRAHYCAEAELVDRWVGRVLQKIDDLQLWDNSIVIFTTDHGMSLGEHQRTGKSNINKNDNRVWPLYPEIAHIPFMIAAPGLTGGRTVEALLQPVDILPTVAELAGLDLSPPEPLHGRSFASALRDGSADGGRDIAVAAPYLRPDETGKLPCNAPIPTVYTRKWCYVPLGPGGKPELYDLEADPAAAVNVIDKHPDVATDLDGKAVAWLHQMGADENAFMVWRSS
ncbi:MAG: sulfatase [Planctomycetota bacterium]